MLPRLDRILRRWPIAALWLMSSGVLADTAHAQARDSAGVQIVDNSRPLWPDGGRWRISSEPAVSIGTVNGPEQYTLYRVTGSLMLSDGRILVANSGTNVSLPSRFTLHEIGSEYVLGRWRDEVDAEYVRLYSLVKP